MFKLLCTTALTAAFMSDRCATVQVVGENGEPLTINQSDYDASPDDFELIGGESTTTTEIGTNAPADDLDVTKGELEKLAVEEGIDLESIAGTGSGGNVVKDDIVAAIKAKRAAPTAETGPKPTLVSKNADGKFIVTDAKGEPITGNEAIDESGYETEQDAWGAITAANAE